MSQRPSMDWADAATRQDFLENGSKWLQYYADPVVRENMTQRGIGDHFEKWTQADKLAYAFILEAHEAMREEDEAGLSDPEDVGLANPEGVAKGFGLRYELVDRAAAQAQAANYRGDIEAAYI